MELLPCVLVPMILTPQYYEWYVQQMKRHLTREAAEVAEEASIDHYGVSTSNPAFCTVLAPSPENAPLMPEKEHHAFSWIVVPIPS